jgi:serine/threonine protein kinase
MDTLTVSEYAAQLATGQFFAGWRVERELARGGMGVLYLAHHPRLPRTDVIKVLSPQLSADARFRERFLREVTRMSTLSHPHLMPIHDSGESDDGTLYLVMPYISNGDLRQLLRSGGPLAPARAARLTGQLAAALDAAHRVGVVHRDVKPENVLLASVEPDDSDHALLTDFGISREDMGTNTLTATGELLLTPAYASPEQVLGHVVDARADQYALGCILFELLTGRPPYRNDVQVVMLMAHVQQPVPRLAAELGLPPAVDGVLARAMAKSAGDRFPNCRSMAQAALAALDVAASVPRPVVDLRDTAYATPPPPLRTPPPAAWPARPAWQDPQDLQERQAPPTRQAPAVAQPAQAAQARPPQAPPPQAPAQEPEPAPRGPDSPRGFGPTSSFGPSFPPPDTPSTRGPRRRRMGIAVLVAVVVATGAGVAIAVTGGGGSSKPSAAYQALLARVPVGVRASCQDTTGRLSAPERPHVVTRAACSKSIDGRDLAVAYRSLNGDADAIHKYRAGVLRLGGKFNSPGNCLTFQSTDTSIPLGTRGFAQNVESPLVTGTLWCEKDGTLWYLQASAKPGHLLILTEAQTSAGGAQAQAPQRFLDLGAVAPAS